MTLDIIPFAGLCNRMRVIASAYECARRCDCTARVLWDTTNPGCKASFHSIFRRVELPDLVIEDTSRLIARAHSKWNLYLPLILRKIRYRNLIENYNWNWTGKALELPGLKGTAAIYSMHQCGDNYPLDKLFRPVPELSDRIEALVPSGDFIGVHIRRTDHIQSIKHSSVEDYISSMDRELENNPDVHFFLATDDEGVKRQIRDHFSDERISTAESPLCRDTLPGIQAAVVDLYSLSRCRKIIGSYYSSYSEIAAEIGHIDLIIP